jgi:triphosphoribosyl-dephospho-CoA synthetase
LTRKVVLSYRLPAKHKSKIHERLFGKRAPRSWEKRRGGILNKYVDRWDHGEIWARPGKLARVKSILRANNVAFTDGPRPRKRSSILRARRRRRAAYASWYREYLRYLKELKAISKGHIDLGLPGAKSEYKSIKKSIEKAEEALEKLRPRPELKEWYLKYCRGKVIAYARGQGPNVEHLMTLVKALRSVIAKRAIDASELAAELYELAASDEITDRRTADRLCRLARQMNLGAVKQLIRWRLEGGHLPAT